MSGAQRGKRGKERTYTLTQLQTALYALIAQVARGQSPRWTVAARAGGIKGCTATVRRYGLRLLRVGAEDPSHHALEQRRVAIGALELPRKGNPLLRGRRLFGANDLETSSPPPCAGTPKWASVWTSGESRR